MYKQEEGIPIFFSHLQVSVTSSVLWDLNNGIVRSSVILLLPLFIKIS